jgi:hypothetical protein
MYASLNQTYDYASEEEEKFFQASVPRIQSVQDRMVIVFCYFLPLAPVVAYLFCCCML